MKPCPRILLIVSLAAVTHAVAAPAKVVIKERISEAELLERRGKSELPYQRNAGMVEAEKSQAPVDEVADLMARSVFLVDGKHSTILPTGAVIHIPESRVASVVRTTDLEMVSWPDFLRNNRGWIREMAVDADQVVGKKEIDPKAAKALGGTGAVVVTTYVQQPVAPVAAVKEAFAKALETK